MAKNKSGSADPFRLLGKKEFDRAKKGHAHVFGKKKFRCMTDSLGHPTPDNKPTVELVVNVSQGFIPLWVNDTILRWRFQEQSLVQFADPEAAKSAVRTLMGQALVGWGDAAPVKFTEANDAWDFEISLNETDDCDINGCVLARSFFPDGGRHEFFIYPIMFKQSNQEQVETIEHELGHTFGLRHFFAKISETGSPSEIFGKHKAFTIMNYGAKSTLTKTDRDDLARLYSMARAGTLKEINGTKIRLVRPFHAV
jgi:Metallo-peptidase family M12